jgi:hypothetical protein
MTTQERVAALQKFGYNQDESRFLCASALHSGYFLRRQYLDFIGGTKGWRDVVLLNRLKANKHSQVTICRHNRMVYHLSAKPLYDALGERDNRNRRERQPSTIKNKLMGLDFVLAHPQHRYLATEREKLDYFLGTLKIAPKDLPTRWYESRRGREASAKHFVDKYPLFLSVPPGGTAPVVHFCFVDEGVQSTDRFATHLDHYGRLMAALPDFRVIYIAQHSGLFANARRTFEQFRGRCGQRASVLDPATRELLEYFEARQAYQTGDFSSFDTARLIRHREEKKQFAGDRYEALYGEWRAGGRSAVLSALHPGIDPKDVPIERFSTYVLEYDYDLFGTITSGPRKRTEGATAIVSVQTQP